MNKKQRAYRRLTDERIAALREQCAAVPSGDEWLPLAIAAYQAGYELAVAPPGPKQGAAFARYDAATMALTDCLARLRGRVAQLTDLRDSLLAGSLIVVEGGYVHEGRHRRMH